MVRQGESLHMSEVAHQADANIESDSVLSQE